MEFTKMFPNLGKIRITGTETKLGSGIPLTHISIPYP